MKLSKEHSLKMISEDIYIIRDLMYKVKDRAGRIDDPLVIEISQFLDMKLNQQGKLEQSDK
ncbi:hypothetical protein ACM26V_02535 [Salipaludibacillus sp. HK11]|uniref:hypothetical protein n=1 Tax=Salipaludibacillus sp. HK11 TaxID=3394320 RepID=UPI0039FDA434